MPIWSGSLLTHRAATSTSTSVAIRRLAHRIIRYVAIDHILLPCSLITSAGLLQERQFPAVSPCQARILEKQQLPTPPPGSRMHCGRIDNLKPEQTYDFQVGNLSLGEEALENLFALRLRLTSPNADGLHGRRLSEPKSPTKLCRFSPSTRYDTRGIVAETRGHFSSVFRLEVQRAHSRCRGQCVRRIAIE